MPENDAAVAQHEVQAVGTDHRARDDEPEQVGDLELVEQQRRPEDDGHDEQELEDRILEREGDGCVADERLYERYEEGKREHVRVTFLQK